MSNDPTVKKTMTDVFNPYVDFPCFSREQIKTYSSMFKKYDADKDGQLDIEEMKKMMEALGHPQTHLELLKMIREVDTGRNGSIGKKEFFTIFQKAQEGTLENCAGLTALATSANEIDVSEVGVSGAKSFFESKVNELASSKNMEEEIKAERRKSQEAAELNRMRKAEFKSKMAQFNGKAAG
jgi:hypothetical protein